MTDKGADGCHECKRVPHIPCIKKKKESSFSMIIRINIH
jgi:hypothetical protein